MVLNFIREAREVDWLRKNRGHGDNIGLEINGHREDDAYDSV